jgi:hypothetical protein
MGLLNINTNARIDFRELTRYGGEGSGNFGHAGRPGEVGGSSDNESQIASKFNDRVKPLYEKAKEKGFVLVPVDDVDYRPGLYGSKEGKCETNVFNLVKSDPERYFPVGGYMIQHESSIVEHWWVFDKVKNTHVEITPMGSDRKDWLTGYWGIVNKDINDEISSADNFYDGPDFLKGGHVWYKYLKEPTTHGGAGSGNHGHKGVKGQYGGSAKKGEGTFQSNITATHKTVEGKTNRQLANEALKAMSLIETFEQGTILNPVNLASSRMPDGRTLIQTIYEDGYVMYTDGWFIVEVDAYSLYVDVTGFAMKEMGISDRKIIDTVNSDEEELSI